MNIWPVTRLSQHLEIVTEMRILNLAVTTEIFSLVND